MICSGVCFENFLVIMRSAGLCAAKSAQTKGSKVEIPPLTMRHNQEVAHELGAGRLTCVGTALETVDVQNRRRDNNPDPASRHDASI